MTVAMLMKNTLLAARHHIPYDEERTATKGSGGRKGGGKGRKKGGGRKKG